MKTYSVETTKNTTKNNTKIDKLVIGLLSLLLFIIFGCSTVSQSPTKRHKNLSYIYNDAEAFIHPQYQVYNLKEDSSIVFVKIPFSDLLIKDLGKNYEKYSTIELHFRVYESLTTGGIIDSATMIQKLIVKDNESYKILSFKVKSPNLMQTFLNIQIKDMFSERSRKDYIEIDKTKSVNRQSFLIKDAQTREPVFGNEILINKIYDIQSPLMLKYPLYIQEQNLISSIPNIPSSIQRAPSLQFTSDTTYLSQDWTLSPEQPKLFFLTFDTTKIIGLALFAYDSVDNYVRTPSQMLKPLTYLLAPKEYAVLLQDSNPKYALDRFWLKSATNVKHAKEMIKVYYHRVDVSNHYFSSYKQGWMTDRGMIYTVFGEPAIIYKSQSLERWIYGSMDSEASLTFDFEKQKNPFSDNDFQLVRDESYQQIWFQAIDSWRNGRIYSIAK